MTHVGTLGNELGKLGLSQDPREILGHSLTFGDNQGHIVCGIITSIGYGPREAVSFRISSPKFHGGDIKKVVPLEDGTAWLYLEPDLTIAGQFAIL